MNNGTVFCRPRGGLNDMLVQIEKCWSYAQRTKRLLFIDTIRSGFLDSMDNYFCNADGVIYGVPDIQSGISIFPFHETLINSEYKSVYDPSLQNIVFSSSKVLITFDFSENYSQDIIIHEQCGGGEQSILALQKLTLLPKISENIKSILSDLGDYDSIHIRNTDYKTDYKKFFSELEIPNDRKIVICSDDYSCQEYAKSFWPNRVIIPNLAPQTNGRPLHGNASLERRSTNISAIIDLLLLASAKNFYYTRIDKGFISGFTSLAKNLHSNPIILKHLLSWQE